MLLFGGVPPIERKTMHLALRKGGNERCESNAEREHVEDDEEEYTGCLAHHRPKHLESKKHE